MIIQPIVNEEQQKMVLKITKMAGWKHFSNPILNAANERATALVEFEFEKNEDDVVTPQSIRKHETIKAELKMLKSFLEFVRCGGIMPVEEESNDVYEE